MYFPDMIIKKFPQSHREELSINKIQNPTLNYCVGYLMDTNAVSIFFMSVLLKLEYYDHFY